MDRQTYERDDDDQGQAILRALSDDFNQRVLRLLMREHLSQTQLAERLGMKQPTLSRRLGPLKTLGLLRGGSARLSPYRVELRDEIFAVLEAVNVLAEAINEGRTASQRRASRQVRKERLQGEQSSSDQDASASA